MKSLVITLALFTPVALAAKPSFVDHRYSSIGKRGAPVAMMSAQRHEARVGQKVALDLRFALEQPAQNVRVEVNADAGLELDKALMRYELGARENGVLTMPTIDVAVREAGRSSVNVTVYVTDQGGEKFKSFSVPFSTPEAKSVVGQKVRLKTDPSGQSLRVMTARESN
ncbi:MAG: hypothetical protein AB8G17_11515 [Gammaproteobacteria bacterium]